MILFTTGTINQPDAGSVGLAMAEQIRDDVLAHPAWDLVEEFTAAGGNARWYVFKCLASESGLPNDFYVVMSRGLASGSVAFFMCEGYNPATHVASFYATWKQSILTPYDAEGRALDTYTLGTSALTSSPSSNPRYTFWTPNSTSTKWWITVAEDGFSVAYNGSVNGFFHGGAYTPIMSLDNPMPLAFVGHDQTQGGLTRNPAVAGTSAKGIALWCVASASTSASYSVPLGFTGRMDFNDKAQSDQRPMAECGVTVYNETNGDSTSIGWALGKHKRMRMGQSSSVPAGMAFGDAYALDGRLWVPYNPIDFRIWDTGVAA